MLREVQEAGVELDRALLRDKWEVRMTPEALASVYTSHSELTLGD